MYRTLANLKLYIRLSLYNALEELFNVVYRSRWIMTLAVRFTCRWTALAMFCDWIESASI